MDSKLFVRDEVMKFINGRTKARKVYKGIKNHGSLQVLTVEKPLKALVIQNLIAELKNFTFVEKVSDLFEFQQSFDFQDLDPSKYPMCVKLHEIFEENMKKLAESLFKVELAGAVSMTASKYAYKDFLLCHDDRVEDRGVAFILYLEDWENQYGGTLDFFSHDERGCAEDLSFSILPKTNRLVLFSVNDLSHHQVAEILRNDRARLAISGWFHTGRTNDLNNNRALPDRAPTFAPILVNHPISRFAFEIDYLYLRRGVKYFAEQAEPLRREIVRNNCVLLKPFLNDNCYNMVLTELQSDKVKWRTVGSAARRKYQVAETRRRKVWNCPAITNLLLSLQGTSFMKLLSLFILQKLDCHEADISVATEVIKFKKGDYMLAIDELLYGKRSTVDLWLFFNADHVNSGFAGDFGYFDKQKKRTMCLTPNSNGAFIVARTSNLLPFMSYMNDDIGDKTHFAISIKYSVEYKASELRGQLTNLPAIICGDTNKWLVINAINNAACSYAMPMDTDSDDDDVLPHKRSRLE
ncbi:hypothetical protein LSTR_LSTR014087 [Laodelphax striatellus]|uniref:Prolyl 4-hydroxylase alpha subunit domain-containing protein n=1 Tax=Laodelphax striatellus TaxID=195883 RepID=A0A482XIF4_LAOST|nr:hypothetical protein LSTR_LSTR014087 [Laodelphax striatellus]